MSLRLPLIFLSLLGCVLTALSVSTSSVTSTLPPTTPVVTTSAAPVDSKLHWVVLHAENPSGLLDDRQPCSIFAFAGVQCSMSFDYTVAVGSDSTTASLYKATFTQGNSGDNNEAEAVDLTGSFQGFTISGTLKSGDQTIATFDPYNVSTRTQGVMTLTDPVSGASVRFAWKSDLPAATTVGPSTTAQSTTLAAPTTTEAPYTGPSTLAPTTSAPSYPRDCDEVLDRNNGVKTIYINNTSVSVYCQFGSSGALTTLQSRGEIGANETTFGDHYENYTLPFGTAGNNTNFWLGLENMHILTSGNVSYGLLIEVCCSGTSSQQRYDNFTIGDSMSKYILNAVSDSPGVGLDLFATAATNLKDIGRPFTTKHTINDTGIDPEYCEILNRWNDTSDGPVASGSGGWWFGSCANNLNGKYIPTTGQCLEDIDTTKDTGIEMRTTPGVIDQGNAFFADLISYTRVRMAVFRSDKTLLGINGFCNT